MSFLDFIISILVIPCFFTCFIFLPIIIVDKLFERKVCEINEEDSN